MSSVALTLPTFTSPPSTYAGTCPSSNGGVVRASDLLETLRGEQKVLCDGVVVEDDVDLSSLDSVLGSLVITNAEIEGRFVAQSVEFKGAVDFGGTRFDRDVSLGGSVFGNDTRFPGATFVSGVDGTNVRFSRTLDMGRVTFNSAVNFESATFEGLNLMERADFVGEARFTRATFAGGAAFSRAVFSERAAFDDATFGGVGSFPLAHFQRAASFRSVSAEGTLDFQSAVFAGDLYLDGSSADSLLMVDTKFIADSVLAMGGLDVNSLDMDVADSGLIPVEDDRILALKNLEETARDTGSITKANDAAFERQVLENQDRSPLLRPGIFLLGEQVSGYLVKPLRPLRSIAIVLGLAVLVRAAWHWAGEKRKQDVGPELAENVPVSHGANLIWTSFTFAVGASVGAIFAPKPPSASGASSVTFGRKVEWGVQKALLSICLISLVNTIPSVKEIIDAIPQY